jgi:hypothetical protein
MQRELETKVHSLVDLAGCWRQKRVMVMKVLASLIALSVAGLVSPRSAQADGQSFPTITGTSETTYVLRGFEPPSVAAAVGRYRVESRWSVLDASHWRIDSRTIQPALQSHDETVVANGSTSIWYTSLYKHAEQIPRSSDATLDEIEYALAGSIAGEIQERGTAYYATQSVQPGSDVRSLGQATVLGRTADVYQIAPLYTGTESYGRVIFWLDHQYPLVLRLELHGMKPSQGDPLQWVYRVTSLQLGQGPSPQQLAYRPPVPAVSPSAASSSSGTSGYGSSDRWIAPAGFISVSIPPGYALRASGQEGEVLAGSRPGRADALFRRGKTFIYVEEQLRRLPLPAAFRHHPPVRVGRCAVRIGHFWHQQLSWAAFRAIRIISGPT